MTVNPVNDTPSFSTTTPGNSDSKTLSETDAALSTSGTLTLTEPDIPNTLSLSVVSVTPSGTTTGLTSSNSDLLAMLSLSPGSLSSRTTSSSQVTWSFSSNPQTFNYLAKGEQLALTYIVRATDNNSTPTSDDHTITVTIDGTNDTPTASGLAPNVILYSGQDGTGSVLITATTAGDYNFGTFANDATQSVRVTSGSVTLWQGGLRDTGYASVTYG